ncbi:GNAT family N-acetyltransferase [Gynuella sunshinyii]|uniref:Acetyltransferase n=1 Tax=Gynuella sunshinyii YC6258 TaxID=1445510 RepID=A0A0C5VHT9_9GAMM|nr:GNAT family N-acetyltransferase [Gynuella sunshinyii]AJQ94217.1 acetyltransferase [Gynuella sunshinyii YC6258]
MDEILLRRAGLEDAPEISDCITQAYIPYVSKTGLAPAPLQDNCSELIRRHRVYVLADDVRIAGVLVLMHQDYRLLLECIAVHPEYQGRGLGTRLFQHAESEAQQLGLNVIVLHTNELMTESIRLYKRLGYQEVERRVENGCRRVFMEKRIMFYE